MNAPPHIIKSADRADAAPQDGLPNVEAGRARETRGDRTPPRIPAAAVGALPKGSPEPLPLQGHVVRRKQAHRSARPVAVETAAFVPDVPLPREPDGTGEAPEETASPEEDRENVRSTAEWQEHLEEATAAARAEGRTEGHEAGYHEGYEAAESAVRAECEAQREALLEDVTRLDERWQAYMEEREPMLVELALDLAEALLDAPLIESARGRTQEAVAEAVAELSSAPPVTVALPPEAYRRFREAGLERRLTAACDALHWETDPDLAEGDWSVRSAAGAIRRLRSEVLETLRARLGLSPPALASEEA